MKIFCSLQQFDGSNASSLFRNMAASFAVCKEWLPPHIERQVWYYAFVHPTAKVMKELTIESESRGLDKCVRKRLRCQGDLRILALNSRSIVNPCRDCKFAERIGSPSMGCGACRSRPIVFKRLPFSELGVGPFRDPSPRRHYFGVIERRTCWHCRTTYRHGAAIVDFISAKGVCWKCKGWSERQYLEWRAGCRAL